jgi:CRP/FNR family transcriptional regulator, global nitrogen regulator
MNNTEYLRYSSNGQHGTGTVTLDPPRTGRALAAPEHSEAPQARILQEFEEASLRLVERRLHPGDTVYAAGDPDDKLYFLRSGTVRFYKTYGYHKEATTALLTDGGIFGGPDLAKTDPHGDFAEALTEVRLTQVRKSSVVWLIKRRPEVALALFSGLAERSRRSEEVVAYLLPREVSSRLAILLLNLGEKVGEEDETGAVTLNLRLPHRELASMIASTREAVSKAMSNFRREGLIDVKERKLILLDRAALSERTDDDPRSNGSGRIKQSPVA